MKMTYKLPVNLYYSIPSKTKFKNNEGEIAMMALFLKSQLENLRRNFHYICQLQVQKLQSFDYITCTCDLSMTFFLIHLNSTVIINCIKQINQIFS